MREHKPWSKIVLNEFFNETTETSTKVVEKAGTSTRVVEGASSSHIHLPQELREPRRSERVIVTSPPRYPPNSRESVMTANIDPFTTSTANLKTDYHLIHSYAQ